MLIALDRFQSPAASSALHDFLCSLSVRAGEARGRGRARGGADARRSAPAPLGPGELDRFKRLLLPHLDAAFNFARFLTREDGAAEDVVQDAYLRALRAFPGFRDGDAKAWLFAIVRTCFLSRVRARRSDTLTSELTHAHAETIASDAETAEAALIGREQQALLRRMIGDLPQPLCEVLVLREIEEMSYREIATAIDAPIGTVMSRLARARAGLAQAWRERFGGGP